MPYEDEDEDEDGMQEEDDVHIVHSPLLADFVTDQEGHLYYQPTLLPEEEDPYSAYYDSPKKESILLVRKGHFRVLGEARNWRGKDWHKYCIGQNKDGVRMTFLFAENDSAASIIKVLRQDGLDVQRGKHIADLLYRYIGFSRTERYRFATKTGWQKNENGIVEYRVYVLPHYTFAAPGVNEQTIWKSEDDGEHYWATRGTLEEWQMNVAQPAAGNYHLVMAILTAFSGPFWTATGTVAFLEHTFGQQKDGKSTKSIVGGSVLGGGGKDGFCDSFRMTANAFDRIGLLHNDAAVYLEEIAEMKAADLIPFALNVVNGRSKARYNERSGDSYTVVGHTNGNYSLREAMESKKVVGAQEARIIGVPSDAGRGFGIFHNVKEFALRDDLNNIEKKRAFAGALQLAAKGYYGTAFVEFMSSVMENFEANLAFVKEQQESFMRRHLRTSNVNASHVAPGFALKYAVGQLPIVRWITGWSDDEVENAVLYIWSEYLKANVPANAPSRSISDGVVQAREFCRVHPECKVELRGKYDKTMVYRFVAEGENNDFKNLVCVGYLHDEIAVALRNMGLLIHDPDRLTKKMNITGQGSKNCYVVRASFVDSANEKALPAPDESER